MDFVQKSEFLVWVLFTEIMSEKKSFFDILDRKKNIVRAKN